MVLVVLIILSGRIFVHGIADYYLQTAFDGNQSAIESVVSWQPHNAKGTYLKAKVIEDSQPRKAEQLLYRSLYQNPADVRALAVLARIHAGRGELATADGMMSLVTGRMPANKTLHLQLANYWVERQQLERAVHEWSMALAISPALGEQLFPVFTRVLKNTQLQHLLLPYALEPSSWWEKFVVHATVNAKELSTVSSLFTFRSQSEIPLTVTERHFFVQRYIKDKQWQQAYLIWVEGLSELQRNRLSSVYDGSFEQADEKTSFGWRISSSLSTQTRIRSTYGADGKSALMLKFSNEEVRYRNLSQYILLPPGDYSFTAIKRTERLSGRGRLKWFVRCSDSETDVLGESRAILPSMEWEKMQFIFNVPVTCGAQILRLETVGKHAFDHKLSGVMWIDNVQIEKVRLATSE